MSECAELDHMLAVRRAAVILGADTSRFVWSCDGCNVTVNAGADGCDGVALRVPVATLVERPMDAIRAIYRGLNLDPSPYQIEAAWKSVAPSTRA